MKLTEPICICSLPSVLIAVDRSPPAIVPVCCTKRRHIPAALSQHATSTFSDDRLTLPFSTPTVLLFHP